MVSIYAQSAEMEGPTPPVRPVWKRNFAREHTTVIRMLGPEEVRALRESFGMSQTVFGKVLGVVRETVAEWEYGRRRPSPPALKLMALAQTHGIAHIL